MSSPVDDLRADYPGAADAVEAFERLAPHKCARVFASARAANMSVAEVVQVFRNAARTTPLPAREREVSRKVVEQTDHPDFVKWVMARLGAF